MLCTDSSTTPWAEALKNSRSRESGRQTPGRTGSPGDSGESSDSGHPARLPRSETPSNGSERAGATDFEGPPKTTSHVTVKSPTIPPPGRCQAPVWALDCGLDWPNQPGLAESVKARAPASLTARAFFDGSVPHALRTRNVGAVCRENGVGLAAPHFPCTPSQRSDRNGFPTARPKRRTTPACALG